MSQAKSVRSFGQRTSRQSSPNPPSLSTSKASTPQSNGARTPNPPSAETFEFATAKFDCLIIQPFDIESLDEKLRGLPEKPRNKNTENSVQEASSCSPKESTPSKSTGDLSSSSNRTDKILPVWDNGDGSDRDDGASKQPTTGGSRRSEAKKPALHLACPFRKRNPDRFNVRDYLTCATQAFSSFSKLQ